ncbi:peptidoglycan-binding protein LysM [Methyloprofundus sp.]|uniref:peptidoglycan-binding protein LysM n=1 Tax=Methyloprofundus sp. TaxID=2020875 RepID=UPI003D10FF84
MGLFDFASNIGKKLFNKDADAAAEITEYINADNPGIEDLSVVYNDGVATIIGVTDSTEAAQKAILMAGNVNGVTEVVPKIQINDVEVDMATAFESDKVEYYVIESGDSLSKIAKKYYQNAMEYPRIFEANKEVIKDPDLIYPGQKIRIPLD